MNLQILVNAVATERRLPDDVFWLKENAELLGVLASTQAHRAPLDLTPYAEFYERIDQQLRFFPQYYRFYLSLCLDLEDLGFDGNKGEALCHWVARKELAQAELSDLQRGEACRLLARRGAGDVLTRTKVAQRLRSFSERVETFALPNKKAAYELTHIVFYLSDYGKTDPALSAATLTSLEFAGVLAFLDQNHDLLAEVCIALTFAGTTPNRAWIRTIEKTHGQILPTAGRAEETKQDAYHAYLMTGWAQAVSGETGFDAPVPNGPLYFRATSRPVSALRPLSECLYELGARRSGDWASMRGRIMPLLARQSRDILQATEASTGKFDVFFEAFARAGNRWAVGAG
ncbi:hypothetical protein OS190_08210 [Sulfitobacter sp. F26204]|nr:hypothetical protein [Sulfitobacter sp. F26204]MCX7559553.1 hypothetical protein [Sulfitobacter sp. F26204]